MNIYIYVNVSSLHKWGLLPLFIRDLIGFPAQQADN